MNVKNELQNIAPEVFALGMNETEQKFLQKVIEKANEISDEHWQLLTQKTRDWINVAITNIQENKPIPVIPVIEEVTKSTASLFEILNDTKSVPVSSDIVNDTKSVPVPSDTLQAVLKECEVEDIDEIIEVPTIKEMVGKDCKPNYYYNVMVKGIQKKMVCIRNTDKPLVEDEEGKRFFLPLMYKVIELPDISKRNIVTKEKVIKEKVVKEHAPKKLTASKVIRIFVLKNPMCTMEQLMEELKQKEIDCKPATLKYEVAYIQNVISLLKELNMWKAYESNS